MFDSGISVKSFLSQIKNACDISYEVTDEELLYFYNSAIAFIYRDYIRSVLGADITVGENGATECPVNYENIKTVRFEGTPDLEKVSRYFASITQRPVWCPSASDPKTIEISNVMQGEEGKVYYYYVPEAVTSVSDTTTTVPLPYDFCSLIRDKVAAEIYNISNDDALSAKYFGFYNTKLDDFRMWLARNKGAFN